MATKRRVMLICLTGMDGTGKTTQARRLVSTLRARGIRSKYVWNTYQPVLMKPLIVLGQALFFRNRDPFRDYAGYSHRKLGLLRNRLLAWSYERLVLLDYWVQNLAQVRVPLLAGNTVVSDRYVHDAIVNLTVDLGYSPEKTRSKLDEALRTVPRPDLIFFLDAPEEVSFRRKNDIPAVAHLKNRRDLYLEMARVSGAILIDGSRGLDDVEALINSEVKRVLGF